ncbi:MAG: hypothetical protein JXA71_09665 [Chitinispirillaceae bacterium]|nr:hypothetical protein [Chitinispirillaceae bacterium]
MKKNRMFFWAAAAAMTIAAGAVFADEEGVEKKATRNDTGGKIDAIYNEIMISLPGEMRQKLDSAHMLTEKKQFKTAKIDSARQAEGLEKSAQEQKNRLTDELSNELRLQIENVIQEMEKRKNERDIELKEIQRGR